MPKVLLADRMACLKVDRTVSAAEPDFGVLVGIATDRGLTLAPRRTGRHDAQTLLAAAAGVRLHPTACHTTRRAVSSRYSQSMSVVATPRSFRRARSLRSRSSSAALSGSSARAR